jgi:hypothetical protein
VTGRDSREAGMVIRCRAGATEDERRVVEEPQVRELWAMRGNPMI